MGCSPSRAGTTTTAGSAAGVTTAAAVTAEPRDSSAVGALRRPFLTLDEGLPDEVLLRVCGFLGVRELARLACVSCRFGVRDSVTSAGGKRWYPPRPGWSVTEEAARRHLVENDDPSGCSAIRTSDADVLPCVAHALLCTHAGRCLCHPRWQHPVGPEPSRGSWLRLLHEAELAQTPLRFDRVDATIDISEGGALATKSATGTAVAASRKVMRAGRHFAEFTVVAPDDAIAGGRFGLVRPLAYQRQARRAELREEEERAAATLAAALATQKLVDAEDDAATASTTAAAVAAAREKLEHASVALQTFQLVSSADKSDTPALLIDSIMHQTATASWSSAPSCAAIAGSLAMRMAQGLLVGEPLYYRYKGDPDPCHYYKHEGDRIGLCLDLDPPFAGDLAVYKNGDYLGLVASSLSGEYCWAVEMHDEGASVRVEGRPAPPRPHPRAEAVLMSSPPDSPLKAKIEAMVASPEQMAASMRAADLAIASDLGSLMLGAKGLKEATVAMQLPFEPSSRYHTTGAGSECSGPSSDGDLESMDGERMLVWMEGESALEQIVRMETASSVATWQMQKERVSRPLWIGSLGCWQ
jgi:hypothetical protein